MLANFMSACMCYIGLVVGIILGFKTTAVKYIKGIAAGMFIYISLVDMVSEDIVTGELPPLPSPQTKTHTQNQGRFILCMAMGKRDICPGSCVSEEHHDK